MNRFVLLFLFGICGSVLHAQSIYDLYPIQEIKVTIPSDTWADELDSLKQLGHDERLVCTVEYDKMRYDSVGIRYKGNSSYFNVRNEEHSKLPFNLKSDYVKKKQEFAKQAGSFKLSNVFRDPSFLREVLSYEIIGNYMPAPRANYVRLIVNDVPLGLYNNTESVDKDFLKKHFGWKKGTLVKCDPNWNALDLSDCPKGDKASLMYLGTDSTCYYGLYEMKSDHGWDELIELTRVLNKATDSIETVLNVDQVLWMHAFNMILVNLDSYAGRLCHNYYLYQDSFGIFHPIVWDMNLSFGGFRYDGLGSPLSTEKMQKLSLFTHYKQQNKKRPLITNLLRNNLYRKIYIAHVRTILEDFFVSKKYIQRGESIQQSIDFYVKGDENKLYSYESFKENLQSTSSIGKSKMIGIAELMEARTEYLSNHPLINRSSPEISEVYHTGETEHNLMTARVKGATEVYLAYRMEPFAPFQRVKMMDEGENGDRTAGDEVFSVRIEKKKGTQYYIIAEAEKTASLSPAKASFEFHEVK